MIVRELLTRLGFSVDTAAVAQYNRAAGGMVAANQRVAASARALGGQFSGVMARIGMVMGGFNLYKMAVDINGIEEALAGITRITGTQAATIDQLGDAVKGTGATIGSMANVYLSLARSGVETARSLNAVEQIAKTGTGPQALYQLSQGLAKGVLDGEELRSIMEDLGIFSYVIADGMGVGVGELRDLGRQGKITRDVLLEIFESKRAQDMIDKMRPRDTLRIAIADLTVAFEKMMQTGTRMGTAIDFLRRGLNFLTDNAWALEAALSAVVFGVGVSFIKWLLDTIKYAGALAAALARHPLFWVVALLAVLLDEYYAWSTGGNSILGELLGDYQTYAGPLLAAWQNFIDKWNDLRWAFHEIFGWGNWEGTGLAGWPRMKQAILDIIPAITELIKNLGLVEAAIAALGLALVLWPLLKVFRTLSKIILGIAAGIGAIGTRLTGLSRTAARAGQRARGRSGAARQGAGTRATPTVGRDPNTGRFTKPAGTAARGGAAAAGMTSRGLFWRGVGKLLAITTAAEVANALAEALKHPDTTIQTLVPRLDPNEPGISDLERTRRENVDSIYEEVERVESGLDNFFKNTLPNIFNDMGKELSDRWKGGLLGGETVPNIADWFSDVTDDAATRWEEGRIGDIREGSLPDVIRNSIADGFKSLFNWSNTVVPGAGQEDPTVPFLPQPIVNRTMNYNPTITIAPVFNEQEFDADRITDLIVVATRQETERHYDKAQTSFTGEMI